MTAWRWQVAGKRQVQADARFIPGWTAGQELSGSELSGGVKEEVMDPSFKQDDFEVLVRHPGSCNAPRWLGLRMQSSEKRCRKQIQT